MGCETNMLNVL